MAGCYHDEQDFTSDLKIEVAREGDLLKEGQDLKDIICKKNPGHRGFIPFNDLTLQHLPKEIRNKEVLDGIKKNGSLVVRLVVDTIKNGKRIQELGTGIVTKSNNRYVVRTNNHVVPTDEDVNACIVEFHYDSTDRSSVVTSRGVKLVYTCPDKDITVFLFHPIPKFIYELDLPNVDHIDSPSIVVMYKNNQIKTVRPIVFSDTSHIMFYSPININSSLIHLMFVSSLDGTIGYLKSNCFRFQPLPSNLHIKVESFEVHIDEGGVNSRVIPGVMVKYGDEYIVEISESIFQDEVKKCILVSNGEVFGRGTRLFFDCVKKREKLQKLKENHLTLHRPILPDYLWLFDFHPKADLKKSVNVSFNLVCIGHPHGGIKMVTFGRHLGRSQERFDNHYRHIVQPGKDCQCKKVPCAKYTCKTCPGSSGSPVYLAKDVLKLSTGMTHFMGERAMFTRKGELIENINFAWFPTLT